MKVSRVRDQHHTILILEDNPNDALLIERAFRKNGIKHPLVMLSDGQEGIDYMTGMGRYGDRTGFPLPQVIIMDLQMPRKSGLEFLMWMKEHPELQTIPTILLSNSNEVGDVKRAYELGVSTYFLKPGKFEDLLDLVRSMQEYWRRSVQPMRSASGEQLAPMAYSGK